MSYLYTFHQIHFFIRFFNLKSYFCIIKYNLDTIIMRTLYFTTTILAGWTLRGVPSTGGTQSLYLNDHLNGLISNLYISRTVFATWIKLFSQCCGLVSNPTDLPTLFFHAFNHLELDSNATLNISNRTHQSLMQNIWYTFGLCQNLLRLWWC